MGKSFWKTNLGLMLKYFGWQIPLFLLIIWIVNITSRVSNKQLNEIGPGPNWNAGSTWTIIGFILIIAVGFIVRNLDEVKSIFKKK